MDSFAVAVCVGLEESAACTVKEEVPAVAGVPEIWPLEERLSPAGKLPLATDHVYGVVPPLALSVPLKGVFSEPVGSAAAPIVSAIAAMVIESLAEAVCTGLDESLT